MIVNNAIYVDGKRVAKPATLAETTELNDSLKGMAWIGLFEPTEAEFQAVADEFDLHELAVEDAVQAHQRPKIERYGSILFVVLRTAHYVDPKEIIDFGEIHLFIGKDFVISVRHGDYPDLNQVRLRMENNPELLALGPPAVLYGIMDQVVDEYHQVVMGLEHDIDEIEIEVFGGEPDVSKRTYSLAREVIDFQRAVAPLNGMLSSLCDGRIGLETVATLVAYFRDVQDHAAQVHEQVQAYAGGVEAAGAAEEILGGELAQQPHPVGVHADDIGVPVAHEVLDGVHGQPPGRGDVAPGAEDLQEPRRRPLGLVQHGLGQGAVA